MNIKLTITALAALALSLYGAQQTVNTGTTANDGTGDTLRAAAIKINANFGELYTLTGALGTTYAPLVHNQAWSTITGTPTTLSGYGISDALTAATAASTYALASHNQAWSTITGTPTTLSGYGITDAGGTTGPPGLVAEYLLNEASGVVAANSAKSAEAGSNLFVAGDSQFGAGSTIWGVTGTTTITDRYAIDPFGGFCATRFQSTGASCYLSQIPAGYSSGTFTASLYVASNTGSAQTIRMYYNNAWSSDITVPATGWTRVSKTWTLSSGTQVMPIGTGSGGANLDVLIYGAQLEQGSTATKYTPSDGRLRLMGSPAWTARGLDFSGGTRYAWGPIQPTNAAAMTCYMAVKWPLGGSNPPTSAGLITTGGGLYMYASHSSKLYPTVGYGGTETSPHVCNLHDGNWHLVGSSYDGTTLRMWIDDAEVVAYAATIAPNVINWVQMANTFLSTTWTLPGEVAYTSIYTAAHTSAQRSAQFTAISAKLSGRGITLSALPKIIAYDGDSITLGSGVTGYPIATAALLTNPVQGRNFAVSGSIMTDLTSRASTVNALASASRSKNVLVVSMGHNDLVAATTAAAYVASLKAYCLAARAAGWNQIVVTACLPSTSAGYNTKRNAANALILADSSFYEGYVRWDLEATMGPDAAASNATYYPDGTHPSTAGHALLAVPLAAMLNSLL